MVAISVLVAGTLLLAAAGAVVLVRRSAARTAEQQLYTQVTSLIAYPHAGQLVRQVGGLRDIRHVGQYQALRLVGVDAAGDVTGNLPPALDGVDVDHAALSAGQSVTGRAGDDVYAMVPVSLTLLQQAALADRVPPGDTAVLVAVRTVQLQVGGWWYFVVLGVVCLLAAAAVGWWLAGRFARPLAAAAAATGRIAAGDLATRLPASAHDVPEVAALASGLNSMADRLERARDQQRRFLLSVSHDLRTPLTSIRGYADAVTEGMTDDVAGAVAVIATEAGRLERLVQDLLDLARLDADRFSFHPGPVDLADVAARAVDRFQPEAAAAGVALTVATPDGGAVPAVADVDRVHQLVANLVDNACRYATRSVQVGARRDGDRAVLWVDDDGPGIPAADLDRVFEMHFTSDRHRSGSGLGLAIVAELAAAMGGGVRATSPVGPAGGTRMEAWLPLNQGH